jgi:hypothetical protein
MIEASPSRCTPEQWTAEQAARAMGVVDEADGEAPADGDGVGEATVSKVGAVGREEPNPRGGMRWVAGGAALAAVAGAAWWSGAGNGNSREILVHARADGALIAGERTPSSGPGDFNSSNGSSHMKIQTTAAAALLGAAASAFQAQAGDAVQWRVEDGGMGIGTSVSQIAFPGRLLPNEPLPSVVTSRLARVQPKTSSCVRSAIRNAPLAVHGSV